MALLGTLKKDRLGDWPTLTAFAADLRRRETGALAALANALGAAPEEQRELAAALDVLVEVARDLRVPKGARLAAVRCALESGASGSVLGELFAGAGDLATDPRLGGAARRLAEAGLPAALQAGHGHDVSIEAASFARAVHAAGSALGRDRVGELLAAAPAAHAGALAGRFALGMAELPDAMRIAWRKLLEDDCAVNRRAPAAARRAGLVPAWPPNLPDAFASLVAEAERACAGVTPAADAKAPPTGAAPAAPGLGRPRVAPAPVSGRQRNADGPSGARVQELGTKRLAAPVKQSGTRRAIGAVLEGPLSLPPRTMPPIARPGAGPLPGLAPLVSRTAEEVRFDAAGRRVPRPDRWRDDAWGWATPVLPQHTVPPPRRAAVAAGPFAARLQALFDGRPEAVERLCAAVEARTAVAGLSRALEELSQETARRHWRDVLLPRASADRLRSTVAGEGHPEAWRSAAALLLDRLRPQAP